PIASGPVAPQPAPAPAAAPRPRPAGAPRGKKKKSRLPLILGGLVLLFLLCAGVVPVGYFGYNYLSAYLASGVTSPPTVPVEVPEHHEAVPTPPVDPVPEGPEGIGGPVEAAPAVRGAAITIQAADRAIRKIELLSPDGTLLMDSKGSLEGEFPPGAYRLVIKVAGRTPVGKDFTLGEVGLQVACAPDEKMEKVLCKNPEGAVSLVLTGE
ncbi:MAG: hypothetical protein ABIO70_18605, partial [Pseudomonadota bacterium]